MRVNIRDLRVFVVFYYRLAKRCSSIAASRERVLRPRYEDAANRPPEVEEITPGGIIIPKPGMLTRMISKNDYIKTLLTSNKALLPTRTQGMKLLILRAAERRR